MQGPRFVALLLIAAACVLHVAYASFEVELAGLKVCVSAMELWSFQTSGSFCTSTLMIVWPIHVRNLLSIVSQVVHPISSKGRCVVFPPAIMMKQREARELY